MKKYTINLQETSKGTISIETDLDPKSQDFQDFIREKVAEGNADWYGHQTCEIEDVYEDKGGSQEYVPVHCKEFFDITSVSREDLESIGFDTANVDDSTMAELADKMSGAYTDSVYWIDLDILAEALGIPKREGVQNG